MVGESSAAHSKWLAHYRDIDSVRLFELDMSQEGNPFAATLGPDFWLLLGFWPVILIGPTQNLERLVLGWEM